MAKMNGDFSFTGRLGNLSAYRMRGVDGIVLRTKGGAKKDKIKRDPSCAGILRNATEFGGSSMAAKMVRNAVSPLQHVTDQNLSAIFTGLAKAIQKKDTAGNWGQRNVLFSQYGNLLEGVNLNKRVSWESIARSSLANNISRNTVSASVQLPAMLPGINFFIPGRFVLFRCMAVLGVVRDVLYAPSGYQPAPAQQSLFPVQQCTEWQSTAMPFPGESMTLALAGSPVITATDTLVLSVGIEFGVPAGNNQVTSVLHAGAAKIVAVA